MTFGGLTHWGDIIVIVVYLVSVILVGIWSMVRRKRGTVRNFFLAGRNMSWIPIGASLFSSNVGSEHFLGLAGTGAASGFAIIIYEWLGMPLVILLGWIFVPVYVSAGVYTMPEYLERRFGGQRIRTYLSVLSLVLYIMAKLSVGIFAGSLFIQLAMGWNVYVSIAVLLSITAMFTMLGGLTAVIYTDTLQTFVMMIGAIILASISFHKVGGYENLQSLYQNSTPLFRDTNTTCGQPRDDAFNILRDPVNSDLPWPGIVLHMLIGCTWYWCNDQVFKLHISLSGYTEEPDANPGQLVWTPGDAFVFMTVLADVGSSTIICPPPLMCTDIVTGFQKTRQELVIVQRSLAARTLQHAKGGSLLAGYLKILPMFIMLIPGMISRVLYPDQVACVDPVECEKYCGNPGGCSNLAYPLLVFGLLPTGLKGLLVAVMLSAIVSSLTSIFNSSSTLFTMDLWPRIRKSACEREKLIVGRVFIAIMCVISILWTPLVRSSQSGQLFLYINAIQGYLATPIGPVFLFAALWKRTTETAAFWSLVLTQLCGLIRLVLDFVMPAPLCGEPETRPAILYRVHYTYFAVLSVGLTCILLTVISLSTKANENIDGLTYWTVTRNAVIKDDILEVRSEQDDIDSKLMLNENEDTVVDDSGNIKIDGAKLFVYRLCGIPIHKANDYNNAEQEKIFKESFLKEDPFWKNVLDINAVLGLIVVAFLIGFFH